MKFSEDFIEKLRESSDVVELISRHTVLKSSGRSMMGLCPFPDHQEKSPSFSVSPEKQLYHCFGCGKSGNVFSFLRDHYGYSFPEAIEYLAKQANIPLPENSFMPKEHKSELSDKKNILSEALYFYQTRLIKLQGSHPVFSYLKNRDMADPKLLDELQIGWASDDWSKLTDYLKSKNLSLKLAANLGLIKARKDGSGYFDLFRSRVMFPVFSFSGEVLGFGGRVLGDEKPKYLNSPESDLFKKGRILYGQNWASPHIRQHDEAIIVEGYTDWISLYAAGFKNGLATMGTALTDDHAKRIKRWCKKVVCVFDGDEAGERASERALTHILSHELMGRGVFLPQGSDPDSYIKNEGVEAFKELLKSGRDLFLSLLDRKMSDYEGLTHQKIEALNWAVSMISHLPPSSALINIYLQEVDVRLSIGMNELRNELQKKRKANGLIRSGHEMPQVRFEEPEPLKEISLTRIQAKRNDQELIAFNLALESEEAFLKLAGSEVGFSNSSINTLWSFLLENYRQKRVSSGNFVGFLASYCANPGALTLTMEKPYSQLDQKQKLELLEDCLQSMKKVQLKSISKTLRGKIRQGAGEDDLERFMNIQRQRRKL